MRLVDFLIMFALSIAICLGYNAYRHSQPPKQLEQPVKLVDVSESIVRLHNLDNNAFFCTGFVISDRLVVTAAHCLAERDPMEMQPAILAYDKRGMAHPVSIKGFERQSDLGLLKGYFHTVDKIRIETAPMAIDKSFDLNNTSLVSCGFPWGGRLICAPFKPTGKYTFKYRGDAVLYPGMSGGPLFDISTQRVVGLNTGAFEVEKIISPLTSLCTLVNCEVQPGE